MIPIRSLPVVGRVANSAPLTRRGWALVGLLLVCVYLAAAFGARSLNAVVAPGLVALVAAILVVRRAAPPEVQRSRPPDGFPGESHPVELRVDGDSLGVYTVRDGVGDRLTATPPELSVGGESAVASYELRYDRRGAFDLDPVTVEVSDVLGLARRTFEVRAGDGSELLVYPAPTEPGAGVLASIEGVRDRQRAHGRDEFDSLREYDRGDALRDVHWKSSAKRPDEELVVKEFHDRTADEAVGVAVGARGGLPTVDAAASAAASVVTHLLEDGVEVGLETPTESVEPGAGEEHRRRLLAALARLTSAPMPEGADAEIRVTASDGEASLLVDGQSIQFDAADGRARGVGSGGANGRGARRSGARSERRNDGRGAGGGGGRGARSGDGRDTVADGGRRTDRDDVAGRRHGATGSERESATADARDSEVGR